MKRVKIKIIGKNDILPSLPVPDLRYPLGMLVRHRLRSSDVDVRNVRHSSHAENIRNMEALARTPRNFGSEKSGLGPESTLYLGFCANGMKIEFEKVILTTLFLF